MRPAVEVTGMRDRLRSHLLHTGGEICEVVVTVLDWACDPLVGDADLLAAAENPDPDGYDLRAEDVMVALVDTVSPTTLAAATEFLSRVSVAQLDELGAAARKLDRLCKAERKRRSPDVRAAS